MGSRARKKLERQIYKLSGANYGAVELHRHLNGADECKRPLKGSRSKALAAKCFAGNNVKIGNDSSAPEAVLYKKDVLAVLQRQLTMDLSQDVFSSLK